MTNKKRFIVETVELTDGFNEISRIVKVVTDKEELYSYDDLYELCDDLNKLNDENRELRNIIKQKEEEEKLYAKEILRLNELDKQKNQLNDILGGY